MNADEIQQILITNAFLFTGSAIKYKFTDTTISVNGSPVTRYNLYDESEKVYMKTEVPLLTNEDLLVVYSGKQYPPTVTLSPKSGADKIIYLQVVSLI